MVTGSLEPTEALRLLRGGSRGVLGEFERSADSGRGLAAFGAAEVWATWLAAWRADDLVILGLMSN